MLLQNVISFNLLIEWRLCFQVFLGGLTVVKDVNISRYNGEDLNQLIAMASTKVPVPAESRALLSRTSAIPTLLALQNSTGKLANFEFFEQIQQIPFNFPHGSSKYRLIWAHCVTHLSTLFSFSLLDVSIQIQHCPIPTRKQSSTSDTAAGILVATHSTGAWVLFSIYVIYIQQLLCTRQMETAVN